MHACVFTSEFLELLLASNVTEISKGLMIAVALVSQPEKTSP